MPPGEAPYKNPHRAFEETVSVEEGAAEDEDRVGGVDEDAWTEDVLRMEELDARVDELDARMEVELPPTEHVPNNG